jgi:hypothetical protein
MSKAVARLLGWMLLAALGRHGDAALFGRRAPLGTGQDETQTELSAGIHAKYAYFSFGGPTASRTESVPWGKWTNLVPSFKAGNGIATISIDTDGLRRSARMRPYLGRSNRLVWRPGSIKLQSRSMRL